MSASSRRRFFGLLAVSILSLLSSSRAGTFKNPTLIATNYDPGSVATADLNHDGNLDLVYVDGVSTNALHVLLGNGDGTFSHGQDIALPSGNGQYWIGVIDLVDVTVDGNVDIVIGGSRSSTAQVVVLPGNGDGTFQPPIVSILAANFGGNFPQLRGRIGLGDINGDGAVDLVAPDPANSVLWVALGDKTGKFTLRSTLNSGYDVAAYLVDLNGDGHLDLVSLDRIGASVAVRLGNGDGTFQTAVFYGTGASTQDLLLVNFDGDEHLDVVANVYPGQVKFLKGNADGTFAAPSTIATVPSTDQLVPPADFNGDGVMDLAVLNPAGVGILLGKGGLTYGAMISSLAGVANPASFAEGDFNKDGDMDIAMGVDGGILILNGKGDGAFASADLYDMGQTVGTCVVADFSGDGLPDVAVTLPATYPRLLLGNGVGGFTLAKDQNTSYSSQTPGANMAVADFNGDGKKDVVELTGQALVLFGAGNGTFSAPVAVNGSTVVGDVNRDGRSDMVATSGNLITSLLGQSNGTFVTASTALRNPTFAGIAGIADLNNDGKLDLLVYAYTQMEIWLGDGDGSFTYSGAIDTSAFLSAQVAAIADLDGDGKADLIIAPGSNPADPMLPIMILYGNGDGTFQQPAFVAVSHQYWQVVVADVNRDNKPDLVMSDGSGIAMMLNLGGRSFGPEEHFVAGQAISGLSVVDVNGDGYPDIIAANAGGTTIAVLLNQPNGTPPDGAASVGLFKVSPAPSSYAQPVTLTVTMSAPSGSSNPTPTGSVSFGVDGYFLATVALIAGKATYIDSSSLATGTHTLVATYDGDKIYAPESFSVLQTVNPPVYPTHTALTAGPFTVLASQTVRLTATVTSTPQVPAGSVTFLDGTASLGGENIDVNGVALLDTSLLATGVHKITATFQGWNNPAGIQETYTASTSSAVTVTVNANPTTTAISVSNTSPLAGTVVTFTANVTSGAGVPYGGTTFYDGNVPLGSTSLKADGSSTFSTASLSVGTHGITTAFNPNATFAGSTSPVLNLTVTDATSTSTPTVVSLAVDRDPANGDAVLTAQVMAWMGTATGEVTFLDGGNILGRAVTDGSGTATLTIAPLNSGNHSLSASFGGSSLFAPGVSPLLQEQWPASGPGFSLSVGASSVSVISTGSQQVPLSVIPLPGFQQQVWLACQDGLPAGYRCSFSPDSLNGGVSFLTIQRATSEGGAPRSKPWYGVAVGLIACCFTGFAGGRRTRFLAMFMVIASLLLITSCGGGSSEPRHQLQVLSIRATSRAGSSMIVHSAQVEMNIVVSK